MRIAAVGPATAARVRDFHLAVDAQPEKAVAESLVEELQKEGSLENVSVLVVRAEVTREVVAQEMSKLGAIVDEAVAYRTVPETGEGDGARADALARFRREGADMVTFASGSAVENFLALKPGLGKDRADRQPGAGHFGGAPGGGIAGGRAVTGGGPGPVRRRHREILFHRERRLKNLPSSRENRRAWPESRYSGVCHAG